MLQVRWIGILILAYAVSNTLQQDSASDKNPKNDILRQFLTGSKQTNDQGLKSDNIDELMAYFSKLNKAENKSGLLNERSDLISGYSNEDHDSKMPKKIKITYRKRSRIIKNHDLNSNKEKNPEKKEEVYLTSEDADLLPTMLDYLSRYKAGNSGDDVTVHNNSTYYSHRMAIITDKPEPLEKKSEREDWNWNVLESDLKKMKKGRNTVRPVNETMALIKDITRTIHVPDKPRSKDEVTHKLQHFSNIDLSNGNNVTTHELKEVPKTAEKKESDASKRESLESKLCESSKSNLSEFWKLASRYFDLDNLNLTSKQKYDLFLTILKKVKQEAEETSPSKPETLLSKQLISKTPLTIDTDNSKELHRSDPSESEITEDLILKLKKAILSGPNNKVVGDLGSEEILISKKNKPDEIKVAPINEMEIFLNKPKNTSDEIDPIIEELLFDIIKPKKTVVVTPKVLQSYREPKRKTATSLDISDISSSNSEEPFSDNVVKPAKITLNDFVKSLKYPQVDSDLGSKSLETPDNSNNPGVYLLRKVQKKSDVDTEKKQDDHDFDDGYKLSTTDEDSKKDTPPLKKVNSLPNDTLSEISILSSEESENHPDKQVLDTDYPSVENVNSDDYSTDDTDTTIGTTKNSSGDATKDLSGLEENLRRLIESNIEAQALNKILEPELQSLDISTIPNNSKKKNLRKLALILQYLKSRPKELLKIILFIKAKKNSHSKLSVKYDLILKHLLASYKNLSLDNSTGGLKGQLEDNPKTVFPYNIKEKYTDANQIIPLKDTNSDEKSRHPFLNLKWNLQPKDDLTKVLLALISRFREYGISHEALREIILYLNRTLTENDGTCPARKLNKKLKNLKKAFEHLFALKKKAEENKKV